MEAKLMKGAIRRALVPRLEGEPLNLFLVRHGRSVGNEREKILRPGVPKAIQRAYLNTPNSQLKLVTRGREQAHAAGIWLGDYLRKEGITLAAKFHSDFARAEETAGILSLAAKLPGKWRESNLVGERNWGNFEALSKPEKERQYKARLLDPLHWTPDGGGTLDGLSLKVRLMSGTLHRKYCLKNVLIVTHGEYIVAYRTCVERLPHEKRQSEIDIGIPNCGIVQYSRIDPKTKQIADHFNWVRLICPWNLGWKNGEWDGTWKKIQRPEYTARELLEKVARLPQIYDTV